MIKISRTKLAFSAVTQRTLETLSNQILGLLNERANTQSLSFTCSTMFLPVSVTPLSFSSRSITFSKRISTLKKEPWCFSCPNITHPEKRKQHNLNVTSISVVECLRQHSCQNEQQPIFWDYFSDQIRVQVVKAARIQTKLDFAQQSQSVVWIKSRQNAPISGKLSCISKTFGKTTINIGAIKWFFVLRTTSKQNKGS